MTTGKSPFIQKLFTPSYFRLPNQQSICGTLHLTLLSDSFITVSSDISCLLIRLKTQLKNILLHIEASVPLLNFLFYRSTVLLVSHVNKRNVKGVAFTRVREKCAESTHVERMERAKRMKEKKLYFAIHLLCFDLLLVTNREIVAELHKPFILFGPNNVAHDACKCAKVVRTHTSIYLEVFI